MTPFRDVRRAGRMTKRFSTQEWSSFKRDAEAADMSTSEAFDWILATASAAGVTKRIFKSFAVVARAEKKLSVMRDAARHSSRVQWFMTSWREGRSSRATTIKALRALLDIAREKRGLAREVGAAEEWQASYMSTNASLHEVLAQQELAPERPVRHRRSGKPGADFAPPDTEDYDPATHGPPIEAPEDDTPEPPGGWGDE